MRNSSISRDGIFWSGWLVKYVLAGLAVLRLVYPAQALDPDRIVSQYLREHWGSERGFTGGSVSAFAQTTDGYLWIGTEKGLIRFDGLNFHQFPQASPTAFPIGPVQGLIADAQGNLWILLQSTKILRYRDGKFEPGRDEAEVGITSVSRRGDGSVLFSSLALGALTFRAGKFEILTSASELANSAEVATTLTGESADNLSSRLSWATGVATHRFAEPNSAVTSMAETSDGKIWLGTRDKGLFYLKDGHISAIAKGLEKRKINCLLPLENSELWVGTDEGIVRWNGTELTRTGVPAALSHAQILAAAMDRDANIWLGTPKGLLRYNKQGVASIIPSNSSSNPAVTALFEDRENDLWIGTADGIERFRDSAFVTFSTAEGLSSENNGPIFVGADGRTWFAPLDGGLNWLKGSRLGKVTADGLNKDVVYSISGAKNDLWVGRQLGGLTHLRSVDGAISAKTYTQADGLAQNSVYAVYQSANGAVWAGTLSEGVSKLQDGKFTTYTTANGLASNTVTSIAEGSDGTMWFATPNGLSSLSKGQWKTYDVRDGMPSNDLTCLLEDSSRTLWIGSAAGLAFLDSGRIQIPREMPASLREQVFGIAQDKNGWLWISTANHVLRVSRNKLVAGEVREADVREYGRADGLNGTEGVKRQYSVFADPDGRIWFSMNRGISFVDPVRATRTFAPTLVHVEAVSADGVSVDTRGPIRIPAARQRITLSYAGLSLSVPENIRFRYQLDGFDRDWSEPLTTRQAMYTNLSPGAYRFHVMASNSDGGWSNEPATLDFTILPAFYQTTWFFLVCLAAAIFAVLAGYQWRVRHMTARLDLQFEERLSERTRIAGELHDTLLQSFQGLLLHFQRARNLLPERPAEAIKTLDSALDGAEQAIVEGREAILDIRSPAAAVNDLAQEITVLGEEIAADRNTGSSNGEFAKFRVLIEGEPQTLHPFLQIEIFRIAREALRNAFSHALASSIETEIGYSKRLFRLRIRDDGKGIDPQVLQNGERAGHLGLPGMRERAKRIGGKLEVWSEPGAGTELELSIPGSIAYRASNAQGFLDPFGKKNK